MKYSEFKDVVESMGYHSGNESEAHVYVKDCDGLTIARIGKLHEFEMATDFVRFTTITDGSIKMTLYTFCRNLAETPLADREEEKRYYLAINFPITNGKKLFLNYVIHEDSYFFGSKTETDSCKTIFTESEISQIDVDGLEKIEVPE